MGNVNGREAVDISGDISGGSGSISGLHGDLMADLNGRDTCASMDLVENTPPESLAVCKSPCTFDPQGPINIPPASKQTYSEETPSLTRDKGIPTIITWSYGGKDVSLKGSWDNWISGKIMQRSGKDHSILLVLPSGTYQYRFIVDGMWRHSPDFPFIADETGCIANILNVDDYVPEILESVSEFEPPLSPESSYGQCFPVEEDFAKEPLVVPPQLHVSVLGTRTSTAVVSPKPQHVVLNHLFIEKGWASHSLIALGLTHRFQAKYVTVVLYKPLKMS